MQRAFMIAPKGKPTPLVRNLDHAEDLKIGAVSD
jgi:hypothetical protein